MPTCWRTGNEAPWTELVGGSRDVAPDRRVVQGPPINAAGTIRSVRCDLCRSVRIDATDHVRKAGSITYTDPAIR